MRNCFQKYMRALQWVSKTMIITERGWHFPQCRYAKLFSKVHANPPMTFENNDYSWEGWHFPQCRYAKSFSKVHANPSMIFENNDYSWEGWRVSQFRCAKSFSQVHTSPSMTLENNDYSRERLTFSSIPLLEIALSSTCEPLHDSRKQWL